jgi:protein TonB
VRAEIGRRTGPLRSLLERRGGRVSFRLSVHFSVSAAGRVASARLARSSGDATLDQAAVSLIRSLSLPPPPGGHFSITAPMDLVQR